MKRIISNVKTFDWEKPQTFTSSHLFSTGFIVATWTVPTVLTAPFGSVHKKSLHSSVLSLKELVSVLDV